MGYIKTRDIHKDGLAPSAIKGGYTRNPWSRTLYVSSTHSRASDTARTGEDHTHPLATLNQALSMIVTKSWTDTVVVVAPGHVETLSASTAVSQAGTQIIGLGSGTRRPTLTFDTIATATLAVSGAGCLVEGLIFTSGFDVAALVTVTGAGCTIRNCKVADGATYQAVVGITCGGVDDTLIENCTFEQETAGAASAIAVAGGGANNILRYNKISGNYSTACISNGSGSWSKALIEGNNLVNENAVDVCIDLVGTSNPEIVRNSMRVATDAQTTWVDTHDGSMYENYGVNNDNETGKLIGTVSV